MASRVQKPSPRLVDVADLKVTGMAWDKIAKKLKLNLHTIRKWPRRYPTHWARALGAARRELANDLTAESLLQLRVLLRGNDPRLIRDAATRLLQYLALWSRSKGRGKGTRARVTAADHHRLAAQLGSMTHDELEKLHDRCLELAHANRGVGAGQNPPRPA